MTKKLDPDRPNKARRGRPPKPRPPRNNSLALKALWASPETRPMMLAHQAIARTKLLADRKLHPDKYSRTGTPNGHTRKSAARLWAKARKQADRFIKMITDDGTISATPIPGSDEAKGIAALHEVCVLALGPGERSTKIAALRTLLEYTRSKPESKSKVTISTSEQLLAEIAAADAAEQ